MKFHNKVVLFNFAGVPVVGNYDNGCIVGLTEDALRVCEKALNDSTERVEFDAVDDWLFDYLRDHSFFERMPPETQRKTAYLHVTQKCNLDCVGCYSRDESREHPRDASFDDLCNSIDKLSDSGFKNLVISGGEPFMRRDLPLLVEYSKRDGKVDTVAVLSNGIGLSEDVLTMIAPFVDCVSVSFDGASADSKAYIRGEQRFEELVESIKLISKSGIAPHIIATIHAKNIAEIQEYISLSHKLNATLNFSLLCCETDDVDDELIFKEQDFLLLSECLSESAEIVGESSLNASLGINLFVKEDCGLGSRTISVAADGTVYPCHMLHRPEFALGNVFLENLEAIFAGERMRAFREGVGACSEVERCVFRPLCGGGCRAFAYLRNGRLDSRDPCCSLLTRCFAGSANELVGKVGVSGLEKH